MGIQKNKRALSAPRFVAGDGSALQSIDVTLTAAQVNALNTTAITLIPSPGTGKAIVPAQIYLVMPYGTTAYTGSASGKQFSFRYTNAAGLEVLNIGSVGLLDQTATQYRRVGLVAGTFSPLPAAALVVTMLSGNVAAGDSPVKLRIFYHVVPTTF